MEVHYKIGAAATSLASRSLRYCDNAGTGFNSVLIYDNIIKSATITQIWY